MTLQAFHLQLYEILFSPNLPQSHEHPPKGNARSLQRCLEEAHVRLSPLQLGLVIADRSGRSHQSLRHANLAIMDIDVERLRKRNQSPHCKPQICLMFGSVCMDEIHKAPCFEEHGCAYNTRSQAHGAINYPDPYWRIICMVLEGNKGVVRSNDEERPSTTIGYKVIPPLAWCLV